MNAATNMSESIINARAVIATASAETVREVLAAIVAKIPEAAEITSKLLDDAQKKSSDESRKRKRHDTCMGCNEIYDVAENKIPPRHPARDEHGDEGEGEHETDDEEFYEDDPPCIYHPGELEVNKDHPIWGTFDYDDWSQQPEDLLDEYPEGAIWSCCDKQGAKKGCVRGLHINAEDHVDIEAKKLKV